MMTEVETIIHDVAFGGSGVGKLPDGKIVFVPYTLKGEKVRVRVIKSRKDFSNAELLEVITPSPERIAAPCVYFGRCGGCQYQHATYEEQLRIKEKQVRDVLTRIGGLKYLPGFHNEAAPQPYGYRNKITVHSGKGREVGFFATDQQTIVDIEKCIISNEAVNAQLARLRKSSSRPSHFSLVDSSERNHIPQSSFHQVNSAMAKKLLEWIHGKIGQCQNSKFLDLYCGAGFFSLGLANFFGSVCGVDRDLNAIGAAITQAREFKIPNAQFFAASVEEKIGWFLETVIVEEATILVDPPREGLPDHVTQTLRTKPCARLIYVSCNPGTLARDLKKLTEATNYSFVGIGLFDMFPQTAHVEVVVALERRIEGGS